MTLYRVACWKWWERAPEWSTGEWSNQWLMGGAPLQVQCYDNNGLLKMEVSSLIMSKNRELLVFCRLSSSHEMLQYSSTLPSPTTATVRVKQVSIVSLEQATLSEIVLMLFSVELWSTATSLPSVTVTLVPFQKHWTVALLFST